MAAVIALVMPFATAFTSWESGLSRMLSRKGRRLELSLEAYTSQLVLLQFGLVRDGMSERGRDGISSSVMMARWSEK